MTQDYLVVVCKEIIIFVALKEIQYGNTKEDSLERILLPETIKFSSIDMNELYDQESIAGGVIVNLVNP